MGTAQPGRLSNSKTLLVTSRPTDPVSRRNVRQMGGLEKGQKRSGLFSAEPETMVPAVGGTDTEKEATGAEKGLMTHKRRLPGGRGEGGVGRHRGREEPMRKLLQTVAQER